MRFQIDRNLPAALGPHLHGQIECGIPYGELAVGEQMPTRDLAAEIELSPPTESAAHKVSQDKKLLESRLGLGAFVATRRRILDYHVTVSPAPINDPNWPEQAVESDLAAYVRGRRKPVA